MNFISQMFILGHEIEMSTRTNESRNGEGDMALETGKFIMSMNLFCEAANSPVWIQKTEQECPGGVIRVDRVGEFGEKGNVMQRYNLEDDLK